MKLNYTVTAFAVSIAVLGCQREESSSANGVSDLQKEIVEKSSQVSREASEAAESAQQAVAQGRQEFVAGANRTLKEIDMTINEFKQQATTLTGESKARAEAALSRLQHERQAVSAQLDKARDASMETWREEIRPGLEKAINGLKSAYQDFKSSWSEN